ncbi:MAG: ABC transporter permease, partial [Phycisphaerales bacterium]
MFAVLTQDVRYGLRTLARTPGFTLVALITLALGIGATTTVFTIVEAVLFRPPGFQDPERLVGLFTANPGRGMHRLSTSSEDFSDWRGQSKAFVDMGLYLFDACNLTGGDRPARALRVRASASLLPVLGFDARIGRRFGPEHEEPQEQQVVLLSDTFWQQRFGADPDVVGETLLLDNVPYSILGVLPPELERAWSTFDVWIPLVPGPEMLGRGNRWFDVYGRLRPGVSLAQAQSEMRDVAARLEQTYPSSNKGRTAEVIPIMDLMIGSSSKSALLFLSLSAACVLLISCTNVANLLLARGTARQREYAIRSALGATRARVTCQLITESAVLALVSGAFGVGLAMGGVRILMHFLSDRIGEPNEVTINGAVLLFALVISLVASLLFGIAPAFRISRVGSNEALKESGQSASPSPRNQYARESLVVAQLALALALVICAGLMIKSLLVLQSVDPGFDTQQLLTMRFTLPGGTYDSETKRAAFFEEVMERIRCVPGVQSAAAVSAIPLVGRASESQVTVEDYVPPNDPNGGPMVGNTVVTPAYFSTLGIPIVRGRDFTGIGGSEATS